MNDFDVVKVNQLENMRLQCKEMSENLVKINMENQNLITEITILKAEIIKSNNLIDTIKKILV